MSVIDLRSDTVTRPTAEMRAAIAAAEVGDDAHGDDPTVNRLQERVAELMGKEAALYVPSGSMGNQLAIRCATEPGDEVIGDVTTHCYHYEAGGPAAISGVSMRLVDGERGIFTPAQMEAAIRPLAGPYPRTRAVVIENTNNSGGGTVWSVEQVGGVAAVAHEHELHVHTDGARLMNACVARGVKPAEYAQHVDSLSMCFSKGLGAPVGSVLVGEREFIARARRYRRMLGGTMRQAGILAAAALYALDHHVERLAEDHARARKLAEALARLRGIRIDPDTVETNIVFFQVEAQYESAADFVARLREHDVWLLALGPATVRAVTHLDVNDTQIEQAIEAFRKVCSADAVP